MQNADGKLFSMLDEQKELLKKDIAKKRALQVNESRVDIQRQIEAAKNSSSTTLTMISKIPSRTEHCDEMVCQDNLSSTLQSTVVPEHTTDTTLEKSIDLQESIHQKSIGGIQSSVSDEEEIKKRKRSKSDDFENFEEQSEIPARKKRKTIANNISSKKDKLYCICKKKYDATKFYVGCDVCNEWFHGDCVGISEETSKGINEFVCDGCSKATDNQEIFCLCQQPYDNTQVYIGCDGCPDWFHGRCVGILEKETQKINKYFCPRCSPNSELNLPNFKTLNENDYDLIRKLVKQLLGNRYAAPFKEPVNPSEVPNYYNVVKVPMDLQTIDQRLGQKYYKTLGEFIGDVMRIFENCRFFNPENSPITKSADNLENYFIQKLALLREKVSTSEN
jgi:nucleosome-remodeling factor subunit BPTF